MSEWPSTRARRLLAALLKIGWQLKRQTGSHRTLSRESAMPTTLEATRAEV
jgi:predicted RNA binding protein YcfA (HicA-like mRNA interferase family)